MHMSKISKDSNNNDNLKTSLQVFSGIECFFDKKGIQIHEIYRTNDLIENDKKNWIGVILDKEFLFRTDLSNKVIEYEKIKEVID